MPSTLTFQANHQSYPLWLEHIFGHLTNVASYLGEFLNNWTVMIATLGLPYLQYQLYKHDEDDESGVTGPTEKYSQMIKALDTLWDHYSDFLFHILPVLFPMVATSGVPLCSSASFAATMTFTIGTASIATRMIFRITAKKLRSEHAFNEWLRASPTSWHKVPNKSFWVLLSLPNVVFFLSIGLLISTVILTFWERSIAGMTPSLELQGCNMKRLQTFEYTLVAILAAAATHFSFIIIKLHCLTVLQVAENAAAV